MKKVKRISRKRRKKDEDYYHSLKMNCKKTDFKGNKRIMIINETITWLTKKKKKRRNKPREYHTHNNTFKAKTKNEITNIKNTTLQTGAKRTLLGRKQHTLDNYRLCPIHMCCWLLKLPHWKRTDTGDSPGLLSDWLPLIKCLFIYVLQCAL